MIRRAFDLGSGVGGLAPAAGAVGELHLPALGVELGGDLGIVEEVAGALAAEAVDQAAVDDVALLIDRSEQAHPHAVLEALQDGIRLRQDREQDHAARQSGGNDLALATLAGQQAGDLLGVLEDQGLDDAV